MATVLSLQQISKSFGARPVVQDLTLSVEQGEIFGLLGPNGAGKTTTIKMILGLLSPDQGEIRIGGHSIEEEFEDAMAQVSGIVENPDMYKYLTGYDNLLLQARACGADPAAIDEVVAAVGMSERIKDKFGTYSLGMKQRLGVAQALLHKPRLMVLDEPTNGLDPAGIKEFRTLLRSLASDRGIAVLVSSHILQEMQMLCDRVGIMDAGRLLQVNTVEELTHVGGTRFRFTLRPMDRAMELLREHLPDRIAGQTDSTVDLMIHEDELPTVNRRLMENGVEIYGVQPIGNLLEDSYIAITGGGNGVV
ncbi:MAG: ABC transporter ATP-binding protein [Acutalibacteraceae bacterium]|jgi:ABC-2 type transport system ATP-binding protein